MKMLFAAFAASVASTALLLLASAVFSPPAVSWLVLGLPLVLLVTLAHALILGVPAMLALRSRQLLRVSTVLPTGFAIGALPSAVAALARGGSGVFAEPISWSGMFGLGGLGVVGACAFWLVWSRLTSSRDVEGSWQADDR